MPVAVADLETTAPSRKICQQLLKHAHCCRPQDRSPIENQPEAFRVHRSRVGKWPRSAHRRSEPFSSVIKGEFLAEIDTFECHSISKIR